MPRAKSTAALDTGARDAARAARSKATTDAQLAEEAQMKATIDAVNAKIDAMNQPVAGVVIKGNQGRP